MTLMLLLRPKYPEPIGAPPTTAEWAWRPWPNEPPPKRKRRDDDELALLLGLS